MQVSFRARSGVFARGAGFHKEGPIAGLGEEEFACGLGKGAQEEWGVRRNVFASNLRHAACRGVKVGVDPRIGFFQPDFPVAFVPPTGGRWRHRGHLLGSLRATGQRRHLHGGRLKRGGQRHQ